MLLVRVLGELELECDGDRLAPPAASRARELLAWLALHPGEHPRGAVAARFWPDVLDASARASLRSAAWGLRRALGPAGEDALAAGRERLGLRCATDLRAFDAHLAAGELDQAVALCRGPLLANLDEDWVLEARDEHAERLAAALARLAAGAASAHEAVAWARRRLALDPLDEDAARDLMRRLSDAGDRPGALAAYDRLCERLRTALGLAPSAATRELVASIRAHDDGGPAPAGPPPRDGGGHGPPAPAAAMGVDAAPLVGRDDELGSLLDLWSTVLSGRGGVAVISGESGIGKTRLAGELLARAGEQGAQTAGCQALDLGGAPPFGLWAELLAELGRRLEPPPRHARWPEELGRLAPSLPRRLGRPGAAPADVAPDLVRARLFEAAVELVEHVAARRALVLMFDDAHLADGPSLELCAYVARRIAGLRVLLVLTRRMSPRREALDALAHGARARGAAVVELDLDPLSRADVELLVGAVADLHGPDRQRVVAAAEGNPLLALESARAAARGDRGPPSSLRAAVRAAVAPLPAPARRVAELAAVVGRDLDRQELAALAAPDAVVAAADCGLLRGADGRFGFRHALLREAVYEDLGDERRSALHEALGRALTGRAAEAARHLRLAGRDDLAAGMLVRAAGDAVRTAAFEESAAFLAEAVALRPDDPAPRLALAESNALLARRDPALAQLSAALELIDRADAAARVQAHLRAARWFRGSLCDPAGAGEAAASGLAELDAAGRPDARVRAELLAIRAWSEVTVRGADAAERTLRALDALDVDLEREPLISHHIDTARGFAMLANGRLREAEALLVRTGEAGERAGHADLAYGGWSNAACVAAAAGDLDAALTHADRGVTAVRGLPMPELQMASVRAYVLTRMGRHDDARAACERQAELAARLGDARLIAQADHDAGLLALAAGDAERAQALLGRALEGDPPVQRAEARLRRAEALARLGRADEADAEIRAATQEPVRPSHRPAVLVARMAFAQALSARARGDRGLAEARLEEAARQWRRMRGAAGWARDHLASLVDLGRPPVAGVVDPEVELRRVTAELAELEAIAR